MQVNKILSTINVPEPGEGVAAPRFYEILINLLKGISLKKWGPIIGFPSSDREGLVTQSKKDAREGDYLIGVWGFAIGHEVLAIMMNGVQRGEKQPQALFVVNRRMPDMGSPGESRLGAGTQFHPQPKEMMVKDEGSMIAEKLWMGPLETKHPTKTNQPPVETVLGHKQDTESRKHQVKIPIVSRIFEGEQKQHPHHQLGRVTCLLENRVMPPRQDTLYQREHHHIPSRGILVDKVRIIEQIVREAKVLLREGRSKMTIQLHPEHLGSVKLKVEMQDSTISAKLQVDNLEIKQLIEANLPRLKDALDQQGLKINKFNVLVGGESGSTFQENGRQQGRRQPFSGRLEDPEPEGIEVERYHMIELTA